MTTVQSESAATEQSLREERPPALPSWVDDLLERSGSLQTFERTIDGFTVRVKDAGGLALCSAVVEDAAKLSTAALRDAVVLAYRSLFRTGEALRAAHYLRMWNFIPGIHDRRGDALSTYYVFNQGRFDAFAAALGSESAFATRLPTATGVGHAGPHLVIHSLTSRSPAHHIENPRQVPAYRYSPRYGPRPPCFSRGAVLRLHDSSLLLVGGTASIRDESSMHAHDLLAQLEETLQNLASLIAAAGVAARPELLHTFRHVRVYHPVAGAERILAPELRRRIGQGSDVEFVRASLCREELLVEIEGVADLGALTSVGG